jgi:hypothetical protein
VSVAPLAPDEMGGGMGMEGHIWGVLGVLFFCWVGVLILHGGENAKRGIGGF